MEDCAPYRCILRYATITFKDFTKGKHDVIMQLNGKLGFPSRKFCSCGRPWLHGELISLSSIKVPFLDYNLKANVPRYNLKCGAVHMC